MIVSEGLTKKFDEFMAVDDIHLDVPTGQVLTLLGPNGAGKTTTVRMLTSVLRPTSGTARVAGYDVIRELRYSPEQLRITLDPAKAKKFEGRHEYEIEFGIDPEDKAAALRFLRKLFAGTELLTEGNRSE